MGPVRTARKRLALAGKGISDVLLPGADGTRALPGFRDVKHILLGHEPREASWYFQIHRSTEGCVSALERETKLAGLNGNHGYLLGNKLVFAHVMRDLALPHPDVFGFAHRGRWTWLDDGEARLASTLARDGHAVVKPIDGRKGRNVELVATIDELGDGRKHDVLVQAFVRQADYARRIFPGSLNTIRVLTVRRPGEEAIVAAAVHRFGTSATGAVDNFSAGGLVATIDLSSGQLGRLASVARGNRIEWSDRHSDTGALVAQVVIPGWQAILQLTRTLCERLPFLNYVGWDLALTDQGAVVIEGNAHPSLRFFQLYAPMLKDERLQTFFRHHLQR